jgi:hypothetical protein
MQVRPGAHCAVLEQARHVKPVPVPRSRHAFSGSGHVSALAHVKMQPRAVELALTWSARSQTVPAPQGAPESHGSTQYPRAVSVEPSSDVTKQ